MTGDRTERSKLRHDLRGPLNTIALTIEVTRRRLAQAGTVDEAVSGAFDTMRAEVDRLDEMIRTRLADPSDD